MRPDDAQQALSAALPVRHPNGAQALRFKFKQLLEALHIPLISASLAAADFSIIYRSLQDPSDLLIDIIVVDQRVELRLHGQLPTVSNIQKMAATLVYFRIVGSEDMDHDSRSITLSHAWRSRADLDLDLVLSILHHQTSFETTVAAEATQQQLTTTRDRLTSVETDLKVAAEIQQHLLLSKGQLKAISPQLDCHAYLVASKDVGGDFFDVIRIADDIFVVVVGDVSGKGVPAAIMMATCSTLIRAYCETDASPRDIVAKANNRLCQGNDTECMFTTLFFAVIDCAHNCLTYCNAGHLPGLVIRACSSIHELAAVHGPALGVFADHSFGQDSAVFEPGDRLILYTDGATESFNPAGDLYGYERLYEYCSNKGAGLNSRQFLGGLLLDINLFSAPELAHDDVTLVSIRRHGLPSPTGLRRQSLTATISDDGLILLKQKLESTAAAMDLTSTALATLLLLVDELVSNLLSHAPIQDHEAPLLMLDLSRDRHRLTLSLKDNAPPFNPLLVAEPSLDVPLDERAIGGLGLFLVRSLASECSYHYQAPWNCLVLQLQLDAEEV